VANAWSGVAYLQRDAQQAVRGAAMQPTCARGDFAERPGLRLTGAPRRRLVPVAVARGGVIVGFIVLTIAAIGVYAVVGADPLQVAPPLHSLVWLAPRRHQRRRLLCAGSSQAALLSTSPCRAQHCC